MIGTLYDGSRRSLINHDFTYSKRKHVQCVELM